MEIKQNVTHFIHTLMKVTLMIYLNQSKLHLYQTYKNLSEKSQTVLLIQSWSMILV